jgi:O-antigen ligase
MRRIAYIFLLLLVLAVPLENMIVFPGLGTVSRIIGGVAFVFAVLSVVCEGRSRSLGRVHVLFGLFIWWGMATFHWSINPQGSMIYLISLAQLFIFVWLIWEFAREEREQVNLMKAYLLGAWISSIGVYVAFLRGIQEHYSRYSAYGFDPNDLGLILALGVPIAWYLCLTEKRSLMTLVYVLYVPAAFLAVALTASRASFIALIVALGIIVWSYPALSKPAKVVFLLVVPPVCIFLISVVPASSWSRLSTIGAEISSGNLNYRMQIWEEGISVFANDPLLGLGIGSFQTGVAPLMGHEVSPHNLFLSILVGQGVVGFLLFCAILIAALAPVICFNPLSRKLWIVTMATWLTGVMTLGWELRKPTWFLLGLLACQAAVKVRAPQGRKVDELEQHENPY